jgi:hypothetical protein
MLEAHRWMRNGDHVEDNCRVITPERDKITNRMSDGDILRTVGNQETAQRASKVLDSAQYDRWCFLNAVGTNYNEFWSEGRVVRYFRNPDVLGVSKCPLCGVTMHLHGWIEAEKSIGTAAQDGCGTLVCPGNMIITRGSSLNDTACYEVMGYPEFMRRYNQIGNWPTCCYVERGTHLWEREHPHRMLLSFWMRLARAKASDKRRDANSWVARHLPARLRQAVIIVETVRYSFENPKAEVPGIAAIDLVKDR